MGEDFSKRVIRLRNTLGLNQAAFGDLLGVSRNYVSMIETGRKPSRHLIKAVENLEFEQENKHGPPVIRENGGGYAASPMAETIPFPRDSDLMQRVQRIAQLSPLSVDDIIRVAVENFVSQCEAAGQLVLPLAKSQHPQEKRGVA